MANSSIETGFFEACECGDIIKAKKLLKEIAPTKLVGEKTVIERRTCLHLAVLAGDKGLLKSLVRHGLNEETFTNEKDIRGDTALHLAVWKYRVDLVEVLLDDCKADLKVRNNKRETPLCIAVKFGFLDVVKKFIDRQRETVEQLCKEQKILHLAVKLNRFKIVQCLTEEDEIIKQLINQRAEGSGTETCDDDKVHKVSLTKSSEGEVIEGDILLHIALRNKNDANSLPVVEGDTPLHIAARNKNEPIVDLLRKVRGSNKHALNSEGKMPLDVAREVTEYHESFRIIKKLTDYPRNDSKPFMYCAPVVNQEKHKRATDMVARTFAERRNSELVVAALLATMTFTAVFTVPGGFYSDSHDPKLGTPVFLGHYMFKLFIIFDCIAFFLSLFVCIMWQMATELTTEDKMTFMTLSSLLTCFSFGFNSCAFMAAVYTILAHRDWILAWVILAVLLFMQLCGTVAFFHQMALFAIGRARFHRLCGVPRRLDDFVVFVSEAAERCGVLKTIRIVDHVCHDAIEGESVLPSNKAGDGEHDEHEHGGYNCSCSSSPCLRNVAQSV